MFSNTIPFNPYNQGFALKARTYATKDLVLKARTEAEPVFLKGF